MDLRGFSGRRSRLMWTHTWLVVFGFQLWLLLETCLLPLLLLWKICFHSSALHDTATRLLYTADFTESRNNTDVGYKVHLKWSQIFTVFATSSLLSSGNSHLRHAPWTQADFPLLEPTPIVPSAVFQNLLSPGNLTPPPISIYILEKWKLLLPVHIANELLHFPSGSGIYLCGNPGLLQNLYFFFFLRDSWPSLQCGSVVVVHFVKQYLFLLYLPNWPAWCSGTCL